MARSPRPVAPPPRLLCGLEVAAARLDINARTMRRLIRDGKLPAYRIGRLIKVDVADVDALVVRVNPTDVSL